MWSDQLGDGESDTDRQATSNITISSPPYLLSHSLQHRQEVWGNSMAVAEVQVRQGLGTSVMTTVSVDWLGKPEQRASRASLYQSKSVSFPEKIRALAEK